ncbi:CheY-like chemotaxis protein [Streptomyces umbrinus]|uniref:CheY-like chemotaxis protein n=1 Tax=Streptomyces umbrinus TaxID=67370 RepID=A0ABU0SPA1_9ACTN|nr:CheY-like chemotaxis protein [Streptomyces umbrinus]
MNEVHAMDGTDGVDRVLGMVGVGVGGVRGSDAEVSAPARGNGQRVLVIVHDSAIVELLTTTLELADYRVTAARTGAQGMARLAEHRFDLVVMDVSVPDIEELGEGRRFRPADRPPVLFLAEYEKLGLLVPELGLGESDYVTVPFRISEVLTRAHVLLRGRGSVRQGPCYGDLVLDDATCQAPARPTGPRPHPGGVPAAASSARQRRAGAVEGTDLSARLGRDPGRQRDRETRLPTPPQGGPGAAATDPHAPGLRLPTRTLNPTSPGAPNSPRPSSLDARRPQLPTPGALQVPTPGVSQIPRLSTTRTSNSLTPTPF